MKPRIKKAAVLAGLVFFWYSLHVSMVNETVCAEPDCQWAIKAIIAIEGRKTELEKALNEDY